MEARKHALVGECISRASVEAARDATDADLEAALANLDHEQAATIAFARAKAGRPVSTEVIARILPGIELPVLTCSLIAIAPDHAALLDALTHRRFPNTKDAAEHEALVLYAAWKAGAPVARIIPELRRLSARQLSAESYALLATIAATIDDPHVTAACKPIAKFAKEHARQIATDDKAMHASITAVLAELPPEVQLAPVAGFTVRGTQEPGRNAPCPCGSGEKYKKCCANKPKAAASPIVGLSYEEFLRSDKLTPDHVNELPVKDLARIDIARLGHQPLMCLLRRFEQIHAFDRAEACVTQLLAGDYHDPEGAISELVYTLLDAREIERARPWIAKLPPDQTLTDRLELAIVDDRERAYPTLVRAIEETYRSAEPLDEVGLAHALLRTEPVLGILAARACIGSGNVDDAELLLTMVEEARDQLNLPPSDSAWQILDAIEAADEEDDEEDAPPGPSRKHAARAPKTQAPDPRLVAALARVDELERTLAKARSELAAERTRPAPELVRAAPTDSGLEAKVRELESLIREGNAERLELRRKLETHEERVAEERADTPRAKRVTLDEPDEGFDEPPVEPGNREVTLPRFERRFTDALRDVPATVAAETMRTIGTLTAGEGFAWRGVKVARDMAKQVLMARVGIHHRLIFRVESGELLALDLITREQLDTTLRRLRMK